MESKINFSKSVLAVFMTVAALFAGLGQAKSVAGMSGTCLSPIATAYLYPQTTTLALHPMLDTPFQDGSNPQQSACPSTVTSSDPLSLRSTCPFEYLTNYDRDRIPAAIQEARCLCDGCLDAYTGQQSPDLVCQPIRYAMQVMRKSPTTPINGFEMYSLTTQDITVGCACSRLV
ncbi:interleukin-17D-like [Patiria miniata]|uniref:Interleukin 17-like protein n=1 Tax=Patiria miniata TaxID=46514 RepID=A0A914A2J9_PATMI|nr:interleukin-17D-like [Patiria miniata]